MTHDTIKTNNNKKCSDRSIEVYLPALLKKKQLTDQLTTDLSDQREVALPTSATKNDRLAADSVQRDRRQMYGGSDELSNL